MPKLLFRVTLVLLGVLVALVGAAYLLSQSQSEGLSSLGSNLIAEFVGAAVTVLGLDYLIKRREEVRLLPVRASAYEDVRVMTHWALGLWREAYEQAVPDSEPTSWEEILAERSIHKVLMSLDINQPAKVIPKRPWSAYFEYQAEKIHKHAERALERHAFVMDPEVHNAVFALVYYGGHKVAQTQSIDRQDGIPRPSNLGGHIPAIRPWFEAVVVLHQWTVRTYPYLTRHGVKNIHRPFGFNPLSGGRSLPATFAPGAFEAQMNEFTNWQESKRGAGSI